MAATTTGHNGPANAAAMPFVHTSIGGRSTPIKIDGLIDRGVARNIRDSVGVELKWNLERSEALEILQPKNSVSKSLTAVRDPLKSAESFSHMTGFIVGMCLNPAAWVGGISRIAGFKSEVQKTRFNELKLAIRRPDELNPLLAKDGEIAELVASLIESGHRPICGPTAKGGFEIRKGPPCTGQEPDLKKFLDNYAHTQVAKVINDPRIGGLLENNAIRELQDLVKSDPQIFRARSRHNSTLIEELHQIAEHFSFDPSVGKVVLSAAIMSIRKFHSLVPDGIERPNNLQQLVQLGLRRPADLIAFIKETLVHGATETVTGICLNEPFDRELTDLTNPAKFKATFGKLLERQLAPLSLENLEDGTVADWSSRGFRSLKGTIIPEPPQTSKSLARSMSHLLGKNINILNSWAQAESLITDPTVGDLVVLKGSSPDPILVSVVACDSSEVTLWHTHGSRFPFPKLPLSGPTATSGEVKMSLADFKRNFESIIVSEDELGAADRSSAIISERFKGKNRQA